MDKVARLRQKKDQQNASACRQKVRRRWWEKRSINRDIEEIEISEHKDEPVSLESTAEGTGEEQEVPTVSGGPPASVKEEEPLSIHPRPAYDSTCESSGSPVEEWEALYSSDDIARKLRPLQGDQTTTPTPEVSYSEGEKTPSHRTPSASSVCACGRRPDGKDVSEVRQHHDKPDPPFIRKEGKDAEKKSTRGEKYS
ncbi:Uncharacterized protein HZ326_21529 [Fusarium oxysporum f. sp. albedinis]|nr:Uncharacterized protein HZ326_21529 [Fusarium oxysporum f. sp. albedinis]